MIKVLIVDDHELIRVGIKRLLSDVQGIEVIGEAESGEEALQFIRQSRPDVVLMDVNMPGMGGLEATRRLLRIDQDIQVLAVTVYGGEPYPSRVLQAGAAGYITKGTNIDEMVRAIRKVHVGQRYISPDVAQQLALKHLTDDDTPFDQLSEREMQVMIMITSGQKVQEISDQLCLSPKTVNSYRYRLFEKLNVNSDVELTHLAIRHGMLDPSVPV
ncbi:two-component system response regulator [Piscirickettsia salmonis]|uniref:Bacterial regulatory protein, LuxR n=1 Tax=Piscirickettsia salmonis TaxID=1238 RepID=A0A095BIS9_PISSA|nr:UvrY/SirA/GacA family response regulator transcription factor [Piscirickettsia salmonis]OAJ34048.1 Response regulator UvrY [Piscirickettsiaceae bacterium NZ-RLO1]RNC78382.1 two-component system response regulator UvrY [Piscirickettsiaceae bacterium NZ-RLO2]AKP73280.1 two-component system response regulator [Piscirickettsia salmonis LF-89 = ATCC VR-1361]ALA24286.1 bacterial regulatory s, luxR family protein [Piscirickettsia salmonis]ALB21974.1 bacterial regulatory protein, LuxR [Piscirickett